MDDEQSDDQQATPRRSRTLFDRDSTGVYDEEVPGEGIPVGSSDDEDAESDTDGEGNDSPSDEGGAGGEGEKSEGKFSDKEKKLGGDKAPETPVDEQESGFVKGHIDKLRSGNQKRKSFFKKKGAWIGMGSGGVMIVFLLVFLSFMGNSKIVHLAENITVYNMARSSRLFRQSLSQATAEAIDTEAISETRLAKLRAQFGDSRVKAALDKVNTYRPEKVLEGLKSDLKPVYEPGKPSRFLGRETKVFKGWEYKGALIEKTDPRFFKPVASYKDKLRFAAEFDAILEMDTRGANSLVRGKVLKSFLAERGIKLRWWEKRGALYKNLKQEAAEAITQQQAAAASRTQRAPCALAEVCSAADEASQAADDVVKSAKNESAEAISERAANASSQAIKNGVTSKLGTALSYTSTIYAVAVPLCLIYEGSIENSQATTDNAEQGLLQNYMMVRSAADQMKAGATTPEAVAGLSGKVGDIGDSIPQRRAAGQNVDSATDLASNALPQASSTGTFSLLNVLLDGYGIPKSIIDKATESAKDGCGIVTDLRTGVVLSAAEIALAIVSFGGSEAAAQAGSTGIKGFLKVSTAKFAEKLGLEEGFRAAGAAATRKAISKAGGRLIRKIGLETVAILGATELAKLAVVKHMNGTNSALATDETLANQADMGGVLYAQQVNKAQLKSKPLAPAELAQVKVADADYLRQTESEKSFSHRYFAISDPRSLAGRMATSLSITLEKPWAKVGQTLPNLASLIVRTPTKLLSSIFIRPSFAAATTSGAGDYNIVQWGYTSEEESLVKNNPDYAPLENQLQLEASGKAEQIEADYGKCYSKTNGELFAEGLIQRATTGEVLPDAGDCSPNNLGLRNPKYGDLVFRWRLAARNNNTLDHLVDMQGVLSK